MTGCLRSGLMVFLLSVPAFAQSNLNPKEEIKASDKKTLGWINTASLGANLSFASNQNVIGQVDGQTQTYGLNLKGEFDQIKERSEWRNTASYTGSATRTPTLDRYTKSSDEARLETIFLYSLPSAPAFGPYAKASAIAPVFFGEDVRSAPVTYSIAHQDGTTATLTGDTLRLTDGFRPLTTNESIGGFWKPVQRDEIKLELRVGLGAQKINADGQLSITGSAAGGVINVSELRSVNQAGVEAAITAKGKIDEKSGYEAGVETLTPFINNKPSGDSRDALRLTNIDGRVKLTSNITSWASFSYDYKLIYEPQLLDRAQQSHLLVLNINYNLL